MAPAYQRQEEEPAHEPGWAIRRVSDRCFHEAEEFVPGQGYIVRGILIPLEEIAEVRPHGQAPACRPPDHPLPGSPKP